MFSDVIIIIFRKVEQDYSATPTPTFRITTWEDSVKIGLHGNELVKSVKDQQG